jgi:hypothetical protein
MSSLEQDYVISSKIVLHPIEPQVYTIAKAVDTDCIIQTVSYSPRIVGQTVYSSISLKVRSVGNQNNDDGLQSYSMIHTPSVIGYLKKKEIVVQAVTQEVICWCAFIFLSKAKFYSAS